MGRGLIRKDTTLQNLYNKIRPSKFGEVVGNEAAVASLKALYSSKGTRPHALLFSGPSGCGKTTLARILAKGLKCGEYAEVNSAQQRGVDFVRQLQNDARRVPIGGTNAMWVLDEAHQLTKDAQNGLLKLLEDTPRHAYIVLATTEPAKLIEAIRTRVTEIRVQKLPVPAMKKFLLAIASQEKLSVDDEVIDAIVDYSDGSPRRALVFLEQAASAPKDKQLEAIVKSDETRPAFDLVRALVFSTPKWHSICEILEQIEGEPENIRRMVLACCTTMLLNQKNKARHRALAAVVEEFSTNFYDSGRAGLVLACWQLTQVFNEK